MSLIIKDKIQELMVGYPTVSDKYDVAGATLAGTDPVKFGDLVMKSGTQGYVQKAASISAVTDLMGFVVATNVKLANEWPGQNVLTYPGEALNQLVAGFIAIELDDGASDANLAAVAAEGAASTDTSVKSGKTYYTRSSSSAGAGYLNDGSYAYTKVASPAGNPSTSSYYELSVLGSNAMTDHVAPNEKVCVILATGKCTTSDKYSSGTIEYLPNCVFTGCKEKHGTKKIAEIYVR